MYDTLVFSYFTPCYITEMMLACAPPTLSCTVGDCDPLQRHAEPAPFGFLRLLLDAEQQHLHGVDSLLDMRDAVEEAERLPRVLTEQRLPGENQHTTNQGLISQAGKLFFSVIMSKENVLLWII